MRSAVVRLYEPPTDLINQSVGGGIFPNLKLSYCIPILKNNVLKRINYRDSYIHCRIYKAFETANSVQLISHLEYHKTPSNNQNGFRKTNTSMTTPIEQTLNFIYE